MNFIKQRKYNRSDLFVLVNGKKRFIVYSIEDVLSQFGTKLFYELHSRTYLGNESDFYFNDSFFIQPLDSYLKIVDELKIYNYDYSNKDFIKLKMGIINHNDKIGWKKKYDVNILKEINDIINLLPENIVDKIMTTSYRMPSSYRSNNTNDSNEKVLKLKK